MDSTLTTGRGGGPWRHQDLHWLQRNTKSRNRRRRQGTNQGKETAKAEEEPSVSTTHLAEGKEVLLRLRTPYIGRLSSRVGTIESL